MGKFIETDLFKSLNVGFAIDEGLASPDDIVPVFFGERAIWWIMIKSTGATGHASRTLHPQTATARLLKTCEEITAFRDSEAHKHTSGAKLGDVFSVNITALKAGHSSDNGKSYALNVIPSEAEAGVDIRIPPSIDLVKFEQEYLKKWTREEGMSYTKVVGASSNPSTSIGDDNEWWQGFKTFCNEAGLKITPEVFPAATDVRFLRSIGIPSLGFTPIPSTPVLLHDHDEFLAVDVYLRAIKVYQHLMVSLTSMV